MQKDRNALIEELLTRSVESVYPDKRSLAEKLAAGERLRIYMGIDPTSPHIHLGHTTNYFLLRRFQNLGHQIIVLIGDFTARVGDPSDKSAARPKLAHDEVARNMKTYRAQIAKIIDFSSTAVPPPEFRFNSEWLSALTLEDVVELTSHFTLQHVIERDIFRRRLSANKPVYIHEFLYPLLQGYDSVALEADVEVGGKDQMFNMLSGRTLVRKYQNKEKFVVTTTLLENPKTGDKLMSKSLGTGVYVDDTPDNIFGGVMALPDESILQCFLDCTTVSLEDIEQKRKQLEAGENPRNAKQELAYEIVRFYHGEDAAGRAKKSFSTAFAKKETPNNVQEVSAYPGDTLARVLVNTAVVSSKSEFTRLVRSGGVEILEGDKQGTLRDPHIKVESPVTLRVGKKRFIKIRVR